MNTSRARFMVLGARTESAAKESADVIDAARNILSMMNLRAKIAAEYHNACFKGGKKGRKGSEEKLEKTCIRRGRMAGTTIDGFS